jgi:hypothetical protein
MIMRNDVDLVASRAVTIALDLVGEAVGRCRSAAPGIDVCRPR